MRRYFLPLLILFAVVGILFATGVWSLPAGPTPPLGATLGQPDSAHAPHPVDDGPVQVIMVDESVTWDWRNRCEDELAVFVTRSGFPVDHLLVTLTDDDDLSLGVAYPDPEHIEALALGQCSVEGDILACRVSVGAGDPGPALDTAIAALLGYSIEEYYRVKSEEGWGKRPAWEWGDYYPLVRSRDDVWESVCLEVER